jgi:hypothetical protein
VRVQRGFPQHVIEVEAVVRRVLGGAGLAVAGINGRLGSAAIRAALSVASAPGASVASRSASSAAGEAMCPAIPGRVCTALGGGGIPPRCQR